VTVAGRVVAVIAGLVGLLFAAADLVREAVLATERSVAWPFAEWWSQLTTDPTWATAVAATATAVVAVALILLAVRQLRAQRRGPELLELGLTKRGDGWWVRLEADLPARNVLAVQARAVGLLAADLARMGGLRLEGLDVVVTRLT
jgi:hypothetical protein